MSLRAGAPDEADLAERGASRSSRSYPGLRPEVIDAYEATTTTVVPPTTTAVPPTTAPPTTAKPRVATPPTTAKPRPRPAPTTTTTSPPPPPPPPPASSGQSQEGKASWYDEAPAGTCAHRTIAKGTIVTVINVSNGKRTTCRVADRGPYIDGWIIDLAKATFAEIAPTSSGVINVRIEW